MKFLGARIALFSSYVLFAILLNSVGTVILQSISTFRISKEDASILEAFKDLPIAIVSFLVASFLPRAGYRRAMIAGFGLVAVACILMAQLPNFTMTKVLFLTIGVSFALVKISVYATIGLLTGTSNEHASLLNTTEGFFMIGVLSGYWIFSAFIDPADPASADWVGVYWLLAVLAAANAALLAVVRFPAAVVADEGRSLRGDFADMVQLFWRPVVLVFVMSAFLYVLLEQGIGTWLPTFNNEVLHLPQNMSVQASSIFAAALAAGRFGAGAILQRLDWYWLLNICIVGMAVLIVVALPLAGGVTPDPDISWVSAPLAAFVIPMIGLFLAPVYPAINSVILSTLPRGQHAAMAGLIVVFSALGGTLGSFITGQTFAAFGGTTAFYLSLVPIAALLAVLAMFRRLSMRAALAA